MTGVGKIVGLVLALILIAALLPTAIEQISTATVPQGLQPLWNVIPIMAVVGIILLVLKVSGVLGRR